MKFPTYEEMEEMAQNVAEKVLAEYKYKGRTIRQWIEIIYNAELGTNLAEVGTDAISRQKAINALYEWECDNKDDRDAIDVISGLPTIQPEIVRCKDCKYHHKRICPIEKYFSLDGFCSRGKKREVNRNDI